jgi:hypothetical protein
MSCKDQKEFPEGSAGKVYAYFTKGTTNKCRAVDWFTEYSVYTEGDYKRCICDEHGSGKASCPQ